MNPQRDEELLRRYREASGELDERPAAPARAAILAAAAREIGARPVDAAKATPRPRTRWPWAAAAAVMLSTLAVLLATQTEREQPSFTAPTEQERPGVTPPAEPAREPAATPPMTQAESRAPSIAEGKPATPAAESKRSAAADSKIGVGSEEPATPAPLRKENRQLAAAEEQPAAPAKTEGAAEADVADARNRAPVAPPAAAPPPASAPTTAEAAAGTMGGLQAGAEQQARIAERSPSRADAGVRPPALAAQQKAEVADAANESEREGIEQRPEDWLKKITRLRLEGRHAEAEAELRRFRERYPQWPVPPAALGPSGTR
jgi:hypothetical protein